MSSIEHFPSRPPNFPGNHPVIQTPGSAKYATSTQTGSVPHFHLTASPSRSTAPGTMNFINDIQHFFARNSSKDIEKHIRRCRRDLESFQESQDTPARINSLGNLANAIKARFDLRGDLADLDEVIQLQRAALALLPPLDAGYPMALEARATALTSLGSTLQMRYQQQGDLADLTEVIVLQQEALALCIPGHPTRSDCLNNLGVALKTRFLVSRDLNDLNKSLGLHEEALSLRSGTHPARGNSLHNFAVTLLLRFSLSANLADIDKAISLHREALTLHAPPHPNYGASLNNLANSLRERFEQSADIKDLDEAIKLGNTALALLAKPHPDRGSALNNLALAIQARFERQGNPEDIHEAILLHRHVLVLHARPHPFYNGSVNNLASALQTRFELLGDIQDVSEAIQLQREALASDPGSDASLNNLAAALQRRAVEQGDVKDIDEAIELLQEALLASTGPDRGMVLINQGAVYCVKFRLTEDQSDITKAIQLSREAVAFHPPPHPWSSTSVINLANALQMGYNTRTCLSDLAEAMKLRFSQARDPKDLQESLQLHRAALELRGPLHPGRSTFLNNLATCLAEAFNYSKEGHYLDEACTLFREASIPLTASIFNRFYYAKGWATAAAQYNHASAIEAYHPLDLDLASRLKILSTARSNGLASEAASYAVSIGEYDTAVVFLEAGRSIFWSNALHLRMDLETLDRSQPQLSRKLRELSRQLEKISYRDTSREKLTVPRQRLVSIESEAAYSHTLNTQWEEAIKAVRLVSGFQDFMKPKGIDALKSAAVAGPIVMLGTTEQTCFVLLTVAKTDVLVGLSRSASDSAPNRLHAKIEGSVGPEDALRGVLSELWMKVAKPVFDALGLQKTSNPGRLWWCPIGRLAFLPIHAAGIYGVGKTDCVSQYLVSSYVPTVSALLDRPVATTRDFKVTAIIEPHAPGCLPLPGARDELRKLTARVPQGLLTALVNTTVESARTHLPGSSIVHFACHGTQDIARPLQSGLALSDGRLMISDIMRRPEGNDPERHMALAFLSACETAKGDQDVPDESMHLAGTLLFSGFRGVVATMW
ncbi:CHAT domain-containing protein [Roridomyces roridus]|uniref:CHAT domain-containing protein n=1 Tax=Roridomyces roridus TaxID=1738132 RepID=A0AAD7BS83_9AGAR|nr:CHAT domain-containing protein [Roridomyces roridus]